MMANDSTAPVTFFGEPVPANLVELGGELKLPGEIKLHTWCDHYGMIAHAWVARLALPGGCSFEQTSPGGGADAVRALERAIRRYADLDRWLDATCNQAFAMGRAAPSRDFDSDHAVEVLQRLIDSDEPPGLAAANLARTVVALVSHRDSKQALELARELNALAENYPREAEPR